MKLKTKLISNSNAFFAKDSRQPILEDEYQKRFELDLMKTKKSLTAPTVNDK